MHVQQIENQPITITVEAFKTIIDSMTGTELYMYWIDLLQRGLYPIEAMYEGAVDQQRF